MQQPNRRQTWLTAILGGFLAAFVLAQLFLAPGGPDAIPYLRFLDLLVAGDVERVAIAEDTVSGTYRRGRDEVQFVATRPPGVDEETLVRDLREAHVEFTGSRPSVSRSSSRASSAGSSPS